MSIIRKHFGVPYATGAYTTASRSFGQPSFKSPRTGQFVSRRTFAGETFFAIEFQDEIKALAAETVKNYFQSVGIEIHSARLEAIRSYVGEEAAVAKYHGIMVSHDFQPAVMLIDKVIEKVKMWKLFADKVNSGEAAAFIGRAAAPKLMQYLRQIARRVINQIVYSSEPAKVKFADRVMQGQSLSAVKREMTRTAWSTKYYPTDTEARQYQAQLKRGASKAARIAKYRGGSEKYRTPWVHNMRPYIPTGRLRRAVLDGIRVQFSGKATMQARFDINPNEAPYWLFVHEGHKIVTNFHGRVEHGFYPARPWIPEMMEAINAAIDMWANVTATEFARYAGEVLV